MGKYTAGREASEGRVPKARMRNKHPAATRRTLAAKDAAKGSEF